MSPGWTELFPSGEIRRVRGETPASSGLCRPAGRSLTAARPRISGLPLCAKPLGERYGTREAVEQLAICLVLNLPRDFGVAVGLASQLGTLQPSGPLSSSRRISNLRTRSLRKGLTRASEILRNPPSRRAGEPSSLHMGSLWKGPTRASGILRAGGARRAGEPLTLGLSFRGVPPASRIRNGRLSLAGPGKDWHGICYIQI